MSSSAGQQGEAYAEKFVALFNFATLPLYWRGFEPEEGKPRFAQVDTRLTRLEKSGLTAKGHPLCWFHEAGCPTWMQGRSFEQWREQQRRRITEIVQRYRGRIRVYDVINEAHDWGNDPQFSQEQLLEMTRVAADATRAADPKAVRVVNNCCLFGEYVADSSTYKGKQPRPLRTPLQYLRAAQKAGVDFEAIGLQVYYPEHDLFEVARMLANRGRQASANTPRNGAGNAGCLRLKSCIELPEFSWGTSQRAAGLRLLGALRSGKTGCVRACSSGRMVILVRVSMLA